MPLIVEGFRLGVTALPPTTLHPGAHTASEHRDHDYAVMHSSRFALIDPQGQVRAYYDGRAFDVDQVVRDIRRLLD